MAHLRIQGDAEQIGRILFEKDGAAQSAFSRILDLIEGAGIAISKVDDGPGDAVRYTIAASIAAGDFVDLIDLNTSDADFTTPGGSLPASTVVVPNDGDRKLLIILAQTELEVFVNVGGETFVEAEVELGGSTINSLNIGRSPRLSLSASAGAPTSSSTCFAYGIESGGGAQNPGNVTWGDLNRTGVAQPIASRRRVLAALEVKN